MARDKIIFGVSGSIAAYKACDIVSYLSKKYDVHVIMTKNATNFVSPLTFTALTKNPTRVEEFSSSLGTEHIDILRGVKLFILAPATANTISKIAHGICDNLLTSTLMAYKGKVLIAPAMNTNMYLNEITQKNLEILKSVHRFKIIEPVCGVLACKDVGIGKLESVDKIIKHIEISLDEDYKKKTLKNKKVLVVSGPTFEKLDDVRQITNISSGKMGNALVDSFTKRGAKVSVVSCLEEPSNNLSDYKKVDSTDQMIELVKKIYKLYDIIVLVAAITDLKVKNSFKGKISKTDLLDKDNKLNIEFEVQEDLLSYIGHNKKEEQTLIGFAAQTDNIFENALSKLNRKKADYIVLNDVSNSKVFGKDITEVYVISKNIRVHIEENTKDNVSDKIIDTIFGGNYND